MKVVFRNTEPVVCRMTLRNVEKIARAIYCSTGNIFINTKSNPFLYLRLLRQQYDIKASARMITRERQIIGYNFKNAS